MRDKIHNNCYLLGIMCVNAHYSSHSVSKRQNDKEEIRLAS